MTDTTRTESEKTRADYDAECCWDEESKTFDWDLYQYLCDIAEYWDCEE